MLLSKLRTNHQIPLSADLIYRGCHCPMHTALASLRHLKGISSLVVGTNECTYYSRLVVNESFHSETTRHYCYLMSSRETVFGCANGVFESVEAMFEEGVEKLLIIMTCVPALIGEDFGSALQPFGERVKVIDLAHFKRNGYSSGYDLLSEALGQWFLVGEKMAHRLGKVTLLNESYSDFESLVAYQEVVVTSDKWRGLFHYLNRAGLKVYRVYDIWDVVKLEDLLLKVPESHTLLEISLNAVQIFLTEHNALANGFSTLGIEVHILNQDVNGLGLAQALHRLGLEVTKLHIEQWHDSEVEAQRDCLELGIDPEVVYEADEVSGHRGKVRFRQVGCEQWIDTPRETWLSLSQLPLEPRLRSFYQVVKGLLEHFESGGDVNAAG